MSLNYECNSKFNITWNGKSLKMERHSNGMSLKMRFHSKWIVTQNGLSLKVESHSK